MKAVSIPLLRWKLLDAIGLGHRVPLTNEKGGSPYKRRIQDAETITGTTPMSSSKRPRTGVGMGKNL